MTLSGTEFDQISEWLAVQPGATDDGRQSSRVGVQANVSLVRFNADGSQASSVKVRDISTSGIGIIHDSQLKLDEQFVVLLPRYGQTLPVLCTTVYWEPIAAGMFGIGAKFERILDQDDQLIAPTPLQLADREGPITRLVHAIERRFRMAG